MSTLLFSNNAGSTLAGAITSTATTLNLASGSGSLFPNPSAGQYFVLTITDAATLLLREIIWCTARSGDTLTVVRAQEGTAALNWNPGDLIQNLWTAGSAAQMLQQGQAPSSQIYYGADTGSVNAIVSTVAPSVGSLATGQIFEITALYANTSPTVTFNPSSLGPYNVYRSDGAPLLIGDIQAAPYKALIAWNAATTQFLLLNPCLWVSQPPPQKLSGNLTLYVSTTGSDSNNGLTSGTPFATIQHAWNVLVSSYNLNGYTATIQLADGTYVGGLVASTMPGGLPNISSLVIQGNPSNPDNVIVNTTGGGASPFLGQGPVSFYLKHVKLITDYSACIQAANGAVVQFSDIDFGSAGGGSHILAVNGGSVVASGNYKISGGAGAHLSTSYSGSVNVSGVTVTISGTPTFGFAFAAGGTTSTIQVLSTTFSGSASGPRYAISGNGVCYVNGAGTTYFPGSIAGSVSFGGQYF